MGIVRQPVRRLKDTFQCAKPYDETNRLTHLPGRRVSTKRKLRHLPFSRHSVFDTSLKINKSNANNTEHDSQQTKRKAALIQELQSFFENHDPYHQTNKPINSTVISRPSSPEPKLFNKKHPNKRITKPSSNTFSHFSNITNLLNNSFVYSTSFTFCCLGTLLTKPNTVSIRHHLTNIFIRSFFLYTCLQFFSRKTQSLPTNSSSINQNIVFRIIPSIFHLIAEYTIDFEKKPLL